MRVYEVDLENGKITVQGEVLEPGQGRVKLEFECTGYRVGCALDPDQFVALVMALHGASGELMESQGITHVSAVSIKRGLLGDTYQA